MQKQLCQFNKKCVSLRDPFVCLNNEIEKKEAPRKPEFFFFFYMRYFSKMMQTSAKKMPE